MANVDKETVQALLLDMMDNTAPRERFWELGIFKFAKHFFPDRFKDEFSEGHYDMIMLLFTLLDPQYEYQSERQCYFLIHREASKTTIGTFLIPMFLIYFRGASIKARVYDKDRIAWRIVYLPPINENFILIASKTKTMAENFVIALRDEITYRTDLAEIFGEKNPREVSLEDDERQSDKMWRKAAFITLDNTAVIGVGAGQQARGTNLYGSRPVFAIIDDMYDKNNIKTEVTRESIRYWFHAELLNSLDSRRGKALWLGTLLHPDTVVKDFQQDGDWFGVNRPIIGVQELADVVNECSTTGNFIRPTKEWCKHRQKTITTLSWADRHDLYSVLLRYDKHLKQGRLNQFYQEFMNEYLAPETRMITPDCFRQTDVKIFKEKDRQVCEFIDDGMLWYGDVNLSIGLDLASSTSDTSDDTVITVAGYARCYPKIDGIDWQSQLSSMPEGKVFPIVAHIEGGKYSIHDYQQLSGVCEKLLVLMQRYKIDTIKMEANGQQEQIAREIDTFLQENKLYGKLWAEYVSTNKADRILSIVLPIIQKYQYLICFESLLIEKLYFQTLTVGMADHDDYADSLSIAFKNSNVPILSKSFANSNKDHVNTRWDNLVAKFGSDAWQYQ